MERIFGHRNAVPLRSASQKGVTMKLVKKIDELADFLVKQFPSRNDLLAELLKEGLRSAAQAALEAEQAMAQAAKPAIAVEQPAEVEVVNPGLSMEQRAEMSARLRALRGQG